MHKTWLVYLLAVGTLGCSPDIDVDPGEGSDLPPVDGPTVEFDPVHSIIPFPNNLVLQNGKVNLPAQPCELPAQTAVREGTLNKLDGFGTFEVALQVTFTEPVDPASLAGNVVLIQRLAGTTPIPAAQAQPIPILTLPGKTLRFDAANCAAPAQIDSLTIVPMIPLDQKSTYVFALKQGIKTATGQLFVQAPTWGLISGATDPVKFDPNGNIITNNTPLNPADPAQLAQLMGIDQLWNAHAQALAFLGATGLDRKQVLVAAEFTTQTTTDQVDPMVADSPAHAVPNAPLVSPISIAGGNGQQFLIDHLPAGTCSVIPCAAVGDVFAAVVVSPSYQVLGPNPLGGTHPGIPGQWNDPVHPTKVSDAQIQMFAVIPKTPPPQTGYPTLVFGHGLTRSKNDMFVFAPQLAAQGIMTVGIDDVASGVRAIQITTDAAIGCGGTNLDPTVVPQCFAQILSTDLGGTRDNIRQTVLDMEALVNAMKACGTTMCGAIKVDSTHLMYTGQSLGGIIGSVVTASDPDLGLDVLNVPGVGLIDILENTASLAIRCSLVDGLIAAGVVMGQPFNPATGTGICTTDQWKTQPGYLQFSAIARWVLDPADGANFTKKLLMRRFLIQEVVDDQVVPNFATNTLGALTIGTPATADCMAMPNAPASAAITTNPGSNKWVKYPTTDAATCAPVGNAFAHGSLLQPAPSNPPAAGQLGTARMQTDAITFLLENLI